MMARGRRRSGPTPAFLRRERYLQALRDSSSHTLSLSHDRNCPKMEYISANEAGGYVLFCIFARR